METEQLLENLRHGNALEAFEAAKSISNVPTKRIIEVLDNATSLHNREAAAYALSWLGRKDRDESLQALLNIFNDSNESPAVRGQALEGFGLHRTTTRHKLWPDVERAVLAGLRDEAVEVRFWACYAAGTLRMKSALPQLRELAQSDPALYPKWWRVSEEAADATEWIHGRATATRVPSTVSNSNASEA